MEDTILKGRRVQLADYSFSRHGASVPSGTTLDEVLQSCYFRNYVHMMKPGDSILALSECMTLDVELRVLTVTKADVTTRLMRNNNSAPEKPKAKAKSSGTVVGDHVVEWGGPKHKWRVKRGDVVLHHGYGTEDEAVTTAKGLEAVA